MTPIEAKFLAQQRLMDAALQLMAKADRLNQQAEKATSLYQKAKLRAESVCAYNQSADVSMRAVALGDINL